MLDEKLYTVADVAQVTGMTSRTIRNYLKDGTLTGQKIGVQWRFTEDEIKKLFSRQILHGKVYYHIYLLKIIRLKRLMLLVMVLLTGHQIWDIIARIIHRLLILS